MLQCLYIEAIFDHEKIQKRTNLNVSPEISYFKYATLPTKNKGLLKCFEKIDPFCEFDVHAQAPYGENGPGGILSAELCYFYQYQL